MSCLNCDDTPELMFRTSSRSAFAISMKCLMIGVMRAAWGSRRQPLRTPCRLRPTRACRTLCPGTEHGKAFSFDRVFGGGGVVGKFVGTSTEGITSRLQLGVPLRTLRHPQSLGDPFQ